MWIAVRIPEVRGEYDENEAALIDKRRPEGIISVGRAIKSVDEFERKDGAQDDNPPSRIDIDLVAARYYLIRIPGRMPQAPRKGGDLSSIYALHVIVDGKTGEVLSSMMEPQ